MFGISKVFGIYAKVFTEAYNVNAFAMLRNPRQAIEGIANLCGYDSDSTLRYAFKAKTGMSMREWRKREGIA